MIKTVLHALSNAVKGAIIGLLAISALQFGYERFTPDHWWVEYNSTFSTGRIIENGLDVESNSTYPRGGAVVWVDRLFCDVPPGEGFRFFSSFTDSAVLQPKPDFVTLPWVYMGALPSEGIECYIESTITIKTFFNLPHQEVITSNTFPIGG